MLWLVLNSLLFTCINNQSSTHKKYCFLWIRYFWQFSALAAVVSEVNYQPCYEPLGEPERQPSQQRPANSVFLANRLFILLTQPTHRQQRHCSIWYLCSKDVIPDVTVMDMMFVVVVYKMKTVLFGSLCSTYSRDSVSYLRFCWWLLAANIFHSR